MHFKKLTLMNVCNKTESSTTEYRGQLSGFIFSFLMCSLMMVFENLRFAAWLDLKKYMLFWMW